MSKIAEQKALEAYPPHYQKLAGDGYFDMSLEKREGYIRGYDQAFQDFIEKAEEFFNDMCDTMEKTALGKKTIELFKNYMQYEM